jgi:hypothetical protein
MPISAQKFLTLRPFLFHLTSSENLERILRTRRLESAMSLFRQARRTDLGRVRRRDHTVVQVAGESVRLRDQAPLHEGNMALERNWTFEDFVAYLNNHVFFWPGAADGPIAYGVRHYERYAEEKPVILRIPTAALLASNARQHPHFCRYNSGSPRCSNGRKSPRPSRTFVTANEADFGVGGIVEVTFPGGVHVPDRIDVGRHPQGPWRSR